MKNLRFDYDPDPFDSSEDLARIIDADTLGHPQGPVTIATVNVRWCAPHVEHAIAAGHLMAAAPELLTMLRRVLDEYLMRDPSVGPIALLTLEQARAAIAKADGLNLPTDGGSVGGGA